MLLTITTWRMGGAVKIRSDGGMHMQRARFFIFAAAAALAASPALAQEVVPGFTASTVGPCDDCATSAVPLGFSVNFFGNTYLNTFVSSNGYVTFNSGQTAFTPTGLGASYTGQPIIAPFFADVDTRGTGSETYGTGTFNGMNAFGVTWNAVGYYNENTSPTNTFQVLLVDRSDVGSGDFDIYFNYDNILWETGDFDGGVNGLGGTSASAGFNAGQGGAAGTFFELPGSLVNGALLNGGPDALVSHSNINQPGRFLFEVRNGIVGIPSSVPEPATWAMMLVGFGAIGVSLRRKRRVEAAIA
jgi:hypothetical protein